MHQHHDPHTLGSFWLPEPPAELASFYAAACCRLAATIIAPGAVLALCWTIFGGN